jgi:hypothetical protein
MSLPETIFAKIKTKRSTQTGVTPNPNSLELGELAVNIQDKKIWIGNPDGGIDPVLLVTPLSGLGPINVSSVNAISFNAANIVDNTVPIGKINRATISGDAAGFLKWNGTAWEFETPSGTGGGETYFAGQGLSLSQNIFSVNAGSGLNFSGNQLINSDPGSGQNIFKNIAVAGQSNVVADNNNDTLTFIAGSNVTISTDASTDTITINATDTNTTYTAGNGLNLTGTTFSVNAGTGLGIVGSQLINTAPDQEVTLTPGSNVIITGSYPNFIISSLGEGGGGGGSSYFDFCTYADFFGDLSIFGGDANSQFCEYVGTNGGGEVPVMEFTAGNGIKIENTTISFEPTTVPSNAINFDKLGRTGILNDPITNLNRGLVEWTGSQWRFASPVSRIFLDDILDVTLGTDLSEGDILRYNGNFWESTDVLNDVVRFGDLPQTTDGLLDIAQESTLEELISSLDSNFVRFVDLPQTTDGSLNIAQESTLNDLLEFVSSFDFTVPQVVGGAGINVTNTTDNDFMVSIDSSVVTLEGTQNLLNKSFDGVFLGSAKGQDGIGIVISDPDHQNNFALSQNFSIFFSSSGQNTSSIVSFPSTFSVVLSSPMNGESLVYDNGNWVNAMVFGSPGVTNGEIYFAGTGLSLDTNNTFSFDPISVQNYSISIQKLTPNTSDPGVLFWNGSAWILQSTETTDGIYQAGNGIQIIENNSALENTWTFSILAGTGLTFSGNNLVVDTSLVPVVNNIGESGFLYWNGFNWEFEDILSSDYIGSVVCLDQLLNVNATNLVNGDFLMYLNGEWINIQLGEYDNGILIIDGGNATLY